MTPTVKKQCLINVAVKKLSLKSSHFELPTGTTQWEVKAPPKAPQTTTAGATVVKEGVNKFFNSIFKKD